MLSGMPFYRERVEIACWTKGEQCYMFLLNHSTEPLIVQRIEREWDLLSQQQTEEQIEIPG